MRALVTGGAGFIGSHLVEELYARGHEVRALDVPGAPWTGPLTVERLEGDITDGDCCARATRGVDVVYHLAAVALDWGPKELFMRVNALGTESMVRAAVASGTRRFVQMSSLAVHHFRGYPDGDESAPRDGYLTPYAPSKRAAEDMVMAAHQRGEIEAVIIRPGLFPFGPRDRTSFYHLARAMERGLFGAVSGGRAMLCTAYVENLVRGVALAGEHAAAAGEVLIIADGVPITWADLNRRFALALGVRPPWLSLPFPVAFGGAWAWEGLYHLLGVSRAPGLTRYRVALAGRDFYFGGEKARRLLGYEPLIPLDEGIRRTAEWYKGAKEGR